LAEIEPDIFALMSDVFGNYVIQKLFEVCNQQEKAMLGAKMEGQILKLSSQMYGCRVS
jgi:pumilio RNA-binding family